MANYRKDPTYIQSNVLSIYFACSLIKQRMGGVSGLPYTCICMCVCLVLVRILFSMWFKNEFPTPVKPV